MKDSPQELIPRRLFMAGLAGTISFAAADLMAQNSPGAEPPQSSSPSRGTESAGTDLQISNASHLNSPFFIFENGLGGKSPDQEAELAKEIGFDGIAFDGAMLVPERLKAVDEQGLQFFFSYLGVDISDGHIVYESGTETAIRALKGRSTIVWLMIRGNGAGAEQRAVEAARTICDLAAQVNVRVALYPHYGSNPARLSDALRIADQAGRSNLGVTFNLCHELRSGLDPDIKGLFEEALPRLYAVSINGADKHVEGENLEHAKWDALIHPLGSGSFDVAGLVQTLVQVGYRGPIGLQCFGAKGDPRTNLQHSMQAWRTITHQIVTSSQNSNSL